MSERTDTCDECGHIRGHHGTDTRCMSEGCVCDAFVLMEIDTDPTGRDVHDIGAKMDAGKVCAGALQEFRHALLAVADVSTYGIGKYRRDSWQEVPDGITRYNDAMWRHLLQEGDDADSGISHMAHACWNMLAKLELTIRENDRDDYTPLGIDELIERCMVCNRRTCEKIHLIDNAKTRLNGMTLSCNEYERPGVEQ